MELQMCQVLLIVLGYVYSAFGDSVDVIQPMVTYMGHRVTLPCKFTTTKNDWMFMSWKRTVDGQTINLATMQNNVFSAEWSSSAPEDFKDHVELQKRLGTDEFSLDLVIDGLICSDVGVFSCEVFTMSTSTPYRSNVTLEIKANPGTPEITANTIEVKENDTFRIECNSNVGVPAQTMSWAYTMAEASHIYQMVTDGVVQEQTSSDDCTLNARSTLTLQMTGKLDGATFICSTSPNAIGEGGKPEKYDEVSIVLYGKTTTTQSTRAPTTLKSVESTETNKATTISSPFSVIGQDDLCNDKLIQHLPDDHLTASSSKSEPGLLSLPSQARLNKTEQTLYNGTIMGAWAPAREGPGEYVQAVFDEMTMITGIQTQGRNLGTDHVTLYKVEYTEDGKTWQTLNNDVGVEQIFMGNSDGDTIQESELNCPIFARGIRIVPLEWDQHPALRFEVNGCYLDNSVVVITTPSMATILTTLTSTNATTVPFLPGIATPFSLTTAANTILTTPTKPLSTKPGTTVNMSTLINWFKTHIYNHTTTAVTTPTTVKTTTPTTPVTTPTTPVTTPTTTQDVFHPGIQNPFGTGNPAFIG